MIILKIKKKLILIIKKYPRSIFIRVMKIVIAIPSLMKNKGLFLEIPNTFIK